jgi:MoxR-like ATPase
MKRSLWEYSDKQRVIPGIAMRENEVHPTIRTRLSFAGGSRILYGPSLALSRLLAGEVAVGTVQQGGDRLYLWEARESPAAGMPGVLPANPSASADGSAEKLLDNGADTDFGMRYVGLFHPIQRRLFWGVLSPPGHANGWVYSRERLADAAEPHWSLYVGALLLAYEDGKNPDVSEIWPLLQEEWRERGCLGETEASREALFLVNAFLWQNRFFYIQDTAQVEPLPASLPRNVRDLSGEMVGKKVLFSWMASGRGHGSDHPSVASVSDTNDESAFLDGRFALLGTEHWADEARAMIPRFLPDEVRLPDFVVQLARMIRETSGSRRPLRNLLFYGPPGSGKSTLAQVLAQLLNLPYYYVNLSLNAEEEVLLGKFVPTEVEGRFRFEEPPFVQAFRNGGLVELMELNFARPGVLGAAHSALETPYRLTLANGEVVQRHPNCVVVATMNLAMVGTQRLNEALKSRFQRKVYVPPLPREDLVEIVVQASGLTDREMIRRMADVVEKMQRRVEQEGLPGQVGTRELIDWAQDVRFTGDPVLSAWHTILPAAAMEHRDIQEELAQVLVENVFGFAGDGRA